MSIEKQDEAYLTFEELDEQQIAEELQGIYAETLVYQFENKERKIITGLSIKGVYELAKSMAKHGYDIVCDEAKITEDSESEYKSSCKATYTAPNGKVLTTYGYSKTSKFYIGGKPNEFAYVQALSKAQRNALRTLIPERFAVEFVKEFLAEKGGRVKNITPPTAQTVPRAEKQKGFEKAPEKPVEKPVEKPELTIPTERKVVLRFLKDVPQFVGIDMKLYGPFKAEDVSNVPEPNVPSLIENGLAAEIDTISHGQVAEALQKVKEQIGGEATLNRADLTYQGKNYGEIVRREGEVEMKFNPPAPNIPPFDWFATKVLDAMKATAEAEKPSRILDYQFDDDANEVRGIHIIGDVSESNFKELARLGGWTVAKATEKKG